MCPDRQIICLYYDKELPSPWKEKFESHLASCHECQKILSDYNGISGFMREDEMSPLGRKIEAASERVWTNLHAVEGRRSFKKDRNFIWNRTVSLPLPALAAAAVALIVLFIGITGSVLNSGQNNIEQLRQSDIMTLVSDQMQMDMINSANIQDINEIFELLNNQEPGNIVIIPLPDNRRFYPSGEPVLINATDYSRRFSSR